MKPTNTLNSHHGESHAIPYGKALITKEESKKFDLKGIAKKVVRKKRTKKERQFNKKLCNIFKSYK